jgi:hypothetical protein
MNTLDKKLEQKKNKLLEYERKIKVLKQEISDLENKKEIEELQQIRKAMRANNISSEELKIILDAHKKN